ncbi:MAG: hypothetical protein E6J90_41950 [Deltaproteobacteria bacterium]|nr:MAG: hypothetical protein E6J90_41950 [Deltaproteobacteria bacterium]
MRRHDDLAILVLGYRCKKFRDDLDPPGMHAILRLLECDETRRPWVCSDAAESEDPQRTFGYDTRRVFSSLLTDP